MESKHPETYFNKLKLRIKLVKILREKFCVFIFVYIPANRLYLTPEIWLHPNTSLII